MKRKNFAQGFTGTVGGMSMLYNVAGVGMEWVSLADVLVAGVALTLAGYEAWLYAASGQKDEHGWLALTAASVAAIASMRGLQDHLDPLGELWATRAEAIALLVMVVSLAFLATATRARCRHLQAVERSRRDFMALIKKTPDAVAVLRDERVLWTNDAAIRLIGQGELDGKTAAEILEGNRASTTPTELKEALARGPAEVTLRQDPGELLVLELVRVRASYDGAPATVITARNVTERRLMTARKLEMDRAITTGTLAAGIGHEINNPLTFALLNVQQAREAYDRGEEDLPELLRDAEDGLLRIEGVVRGLRSFARSDDAARQVNLDKVVRAAMAITGNEVRMRARLQINLSPRLEVLGGETRIGQIITNLLLNAAQAIEAGEPDRNAVRISARADKKMVVLEVSDTGRGMSAEVLERCFEPFYTTKGPTEGTGLGLSIARDLARELGGELTVSCQPGEGTTFTLRLLRGTTKPATEVVASSTRRRRPAPNAPHILIVDDERQLLRALSRSLRRDARITTASSVDEALETLFGDQRFDLILCDVIMPRQTGDDLLRILEERRPELAQRLVFMTGGAFTETTRAFFEKESHRILIKPVDRKDVLLAAARQGASPSEPEVVTPSSG